MKIKSIRLFGIISITFLLNSCLGFDAIWTYKSLNPKCPFILEGTNMWSGVTVKIDTSNIDTVRINRFENNNKKFILTYREFKYESIFIKKQEKGSYSTYFEENNLHEESENHMIKIIVYNDSTILDEYQFYRFLPYDSTNVK